MASFDAYFPTLLAHEGGFVDDPVDPGGATNLGITMATFRTYASSLLDVPATLDNLHALTPSQAAKIYKPIYWDRVCGDRIELQALADIVFDFYVNAGAAATRLLQRVLNDVSAPQLSEDGIIGAATLARLAAVDQTTVYRHYKQGRIDYYNTLAARRPELGKYLRGWLARVASFPDL